MSTGRLPGNRSSSSSRARHRRDRCRGRSAGRSAWRGRFLRHAGRAQRGTRHARPGDVAHGRRHAGQRAPEPAAAASGQRAARGRSRHRLPAARTRDERPLVLHEGLDAARALARRATRAASTPRSAPARWRSPTTTSARRCCSASARSPSRTASRPPALAMIGDASVELGRYDQGFAAFARLGHLRPGLVAYARLSYARELQGDVAGATRLMRRAVDAGSGAPENTQWTRVQLATLLLKSGHTDAAAKEFRHALALLPELRARRGRPRRRRRRARQPPAGRELVRPRRLAPAAARHRRAARRRARGARQRAPAPRRPTPSSASRTRSSSAPAATPTSRRRSSTPRTPAR